MGGEGGSIQPAPRQLCLPDPVGKGVAHERLHSAVPFRWAVEDTAFVTIGPKLLDAAAMHGGEHCVGIEKVGVVVDYRDTNPNLFDNE
jgi:hypothetical protein